MYFCRLFQFIIFDDGNYLLLGVLSLLGGGGVNNSVGVVAELAIKPSLNSRLIPPHARADMEKAAAPSDTPPTDSVQGATGTSTA